MMTLVMALYAEGRSDERFLPTVIQRTTQNLLDQKGSDNIYALEPFVLDDSTLKQRPTQSERILEAARTTNGYHMLIIHADADAPTAERALRERVQPGVEQVQLAVDDEAIFSMSLSVMEISVLNTIPNGVLVLEKVSTCELPPAPSYHVRVNS